MVYFLLQYRVYPQTNPAGEKMNSRKSPFVVALAGILTLSILSQTLSYSIISTASAAEMTQSSASALNATTESGAAVIAQALKEMHVAIDSGARSTRDAAGAFAETLVSHQVTVTDVDNYVLTTASPEQYKNFHEALTNAMNGMSAQDLSSAEFGQVLQAAMANSHIEGLSWAGCAGLVAGVVLAVGALVVGIIALTKTAGESRIRARYDSQRSNATSNYNNSVSYYTNRKNQIPGEISSAQGSISYDQQQIAYYTGVASATTDANVRANALGKIDAYNKDISSQNSRISRLNAELASYNDPSYLPRILADLKVKYDAEITELNTEEADSVRNIPANKKLAGTLGIVAGASAVVGGILIAGGAGDGCN